VSIQLKTSLFWCTIADVKITSIDDIEGTIEEIRELLDSN
jgi:hypothetical protein